jgi:hypothetical protein
MAAPEPSVLVEIDPGSLNAADATPLDELDTTDELSKTACAYASVGSGSSYIPKAPPSCA